MWNTVPCLLGLSLAVCLLTCTDAGCADLDTGACEFMLSQNASFCSDPVIAKTACEKFCNICTYQCYHCDASVYDYRDCKTTKRCAVNELCMIKTLQSTADNHAEYQMTCESKDLCDGHGITVQFGKRDVSARDLSVHCCSEDNCNYPLQTTPTTTTTTTTTTTAAPDTTTTTASVTRPVAVCKKDVFVLVEMEHSHWFDVSAFLLRLVSTLTIGPSDVLLSLAQTTAHLQPTTMWNLTKYTDKTALENAIRPLQFLPTGRSIHKRANYDIEASLQYLLHQAITPANGDRPDAENVVVIVHDTDFDVHDTTRVLASQLRVVSHNIILINSGHHGPAKKDSAIATDENHQFTVRHSEELATISINVANLFCK